MDKLNLDLDDLEVDSFQANPDRKQQEGTVQGQEHDCPTRSVKCKETEYRCDTSYVQPYCASQPWCAPTNGCDTQLDCKSEVICADTAGC